MEMFDATRNRAPTGGAGPDRDPAGEAPAQGAEGPGRVQGHEPGRPDRGHRPACVRGQDAVRRIDARARARPATHLWVGFARDRQPSAGGAREGSPMTDQQFLAALEDCSLAPEQFSHREHVRAAFLYLEFLPFGAAIDRMRATLQCYTASLDRADKYHETLTVAFMCLVNAHRQRDTCASWPEFARRNPELFDSRLLRQYYDPATLASPLARTTFVLEK